MTNEVKNEQKPQDANEAAIGAVASTAGLGAFLSKKHTGTRISAYGMLGRIRDGRYYKELNFGCGEMLRHLDEMAERFYSGDMKAVDEFLQLYDLDGHRPAPNGSNQPRMEAAAPLE